MLTWGYLVVIEHVFEYDRVMDPDLHPTPTALLARTREVHAIQLAADAELVRLAAAWADAHPDLDPQPAATAAFGPDWIADRTVATSAADADHDPLIPAMDWRAGAAFAAALGMSTQAGEALIRDALTLRHRLPQVWARVVGLEVPVWRARRIAQAIHARPADVADYLDEHVAAGGRTSRTHHAGPAPRRGDAPAPRRGA